MIGCRRGILFDAARDHRMQPYLVELLRGTERETTAPEFGAAILADPDEHEIVVGIVQPVRVHEEIHSCTLRLPALLPPLMRFLYTPSALADKNEPSASLRSRSIESGSLFATGVI